MANESVSAGYGLIRRVGICGAGQMGAAAAVCFKRSGYDVLLWARKAEVRKRIGTTLTELEHWLAEHDGPAPHTGGQWRIAESLEEIDEHSDVMLEGIAEDMAQKVALLTALNSMKARGALFLTTTSGLSITQMGRESGLSELLVGTHFWNPPHLMPLVEVVRGEDTPDAAVEQVVALVRSIGKVPVRVNRDVPGFIGNRMLHALWREAIYLVQEGIASPEDVDLVARYTFGLRMPAVGPLENMDLVGLDLIEMIHQYLLKSLSNAQKPLPKLVELVHGGQLGMKSGQGFYDWHRRDPNALIERRNRQIVHQLHFLRELEQS